MNPSYVFGVPVDRTAPGETSTRMIGNYLRGRLPAVVDGETNVVDVRDVAKGHLLAAERGRPGERYVLGGHDIRWVEPVRAGRASCPACAIRCSCSRARRARWRGRPRRPACRALVSAEGLVLMAQNWRYSSAQGAPRARLPGARARPHAHRHDRLVPRADRVRRARAAGDRRRSRSRPPGCAWPTARAASSALRIAERYLGRRLVAP